ncbi:MAG: hypothetical protein CMN21_04230 [Rubinisphaera sp.]|nr:hypothetical protein [Rubinisphaera sp.]
MFLTITYFVIEPQMDTDKRGCKTICVYLCPSAVLNYQLSRENQKIGGFSSRAFPPPCYFMFNPIVD